MQRISFQKIIAITCSLIAVLPGVTMAGALDGGTAPLASDVAVKGVITATGGNNTVVGSGASISNPGTPGSDWSNTAVGSGSNIKGAGNTTLGADTIAIGAGNISIGNQATSGDVENSVGNVAIGFQAKAINTITGAGEQGAVAIGNQANATGKNSVAIGSASIATTDNSVSFGGGMLTPTRVLQNVSDGTLATDVATVGQMNVAIAASAGMDATARTAASSAQVQAANAQATADKALSQIGDLSGRVKEMELGISGSMAMASSSTSAALAALRSERGFGMGLGIGAYNGNPASALSFATALPRYTITGSVSLTSKPAMQIGAGFSF